MCISIEKRSLKYKWPLKVLAKGNAVFPRSLSYYLLFCNGGLWSGTLQNRKKLSWTQQMNKPTENKIYYFMCNNRIIWVMIQVHRRGAVHTKNLYVFFGRRISVKTSEDFWIFLLSIIAGFTKEARCSANQRVRFIGSWHSRVVNNLNQTCLIFVRRQQGMLVGSNGPWEQWAFLSVIEGCQTNGLSVQSNLLGFRIGCRNKAWHHRAQQIFKL